MRWTHLPVAGGLYDQHPKLLDDWYDIMRIEANVEKAKADADRRNLGQKKEKPSGRRWGRRR